MMNTTFGLRGTIQPPGSFQGKRESFVFQGFSITIDDGVIEIGFDDGAMADTARRIVQHHLAWFSAQHGVRHVADLNQSWERKPNGTKAISVGLSDTIRIQDDVRVTKATIQSRAMIVTATYDTASLATYSALTEKSLRSNALSQALVYFNDEALDAERPLYGIYKALEALAAALPDGRIELGMLAGSQNKKDGKKFVDDIMQTAQLTRHHQDPNAQRILRDEACKERAKRLLDAFAKTV